MSNSSDESKYRVTFSTDGQGRWWKRVWAQQCPERVFPRGRCQGLEGHKGTHWCYGEDGSLKQEDNKEDPVFTGAMTGGASLTPPGHANYKTPWEMQQHHYLNHSEEFEVADTAEIARLNRGDTRPGESLIRPLTPEERKRHE